MESKSYNKILQELENAMIANQSKITDFNKGSVIMTLFEAISRIIEKGYIDTRIGYDNNLKAIPYAVFDFQKKSGQKASVDVFFKLAAPATKDIVIPIGTKVGNGTYNFDTTVTGTIKAGELESNSVKCSAENVGLEYNLGANQVTTIETTVNSLIIGVNNPVKADGGANAETDTELLTRFKAYINGLQGSNYYGLKSGVLSVDGVRSVGIVEHFPPTVNEGKVYNATVYVDDGTGNLTDGLRNEIVKKIDGDGSDEYPGLRAAGINIDVQPATITDVTVSATCYVYRTDPAIALNDIQTAVQEYVNGLGIGENVVWTDLILKLRHISYVKDVQNLLINGTNDNIVLSENQIARFLQANILIESA